MLLRNKCPHSHVTKRGFTELNADLLRKVMHSITLVKTLIFQPLDLGIESTMNFSLY